MTTVITLTSFPLSWLVLLCGCKTSLPVFKFHTSQIAMAISTGMKLKLQESNLYIKWMYFNSWLSKRSFQELSCSLYSYIIQFISQTESIWTLLILFVKFETDVLLTSIQIYTKIPKYQVAACKQRLWRCVSGFANTFNFSSKRDRRKIDGLV